MTHALISYLQLFHSITEEEKQLIASSFEPRMLKEGDCLFQGGKVCHELFFIASGVLRIMVTNERGVEVTHFFLKENQFCTILHSFNQEVPAEESNQAACEVAVVAITKTSLMALYRQVPYLQPLIEESIHQRLLEKVRTRNGYLGKDSVTRYQLFMTQQADIARRVPLKDVASYLGMTPQSLSRIRKNSR